MTDADTKAPWQSLTLWGNAVTLAALAAPAFGLKLDVPALTEIVQGVIGLVGQAVAIFGRVRASKPITWTGR